MHAGGHYGKYLNRVVEGGGGHRRKSVCLCDTLKPVRENKDINPDAQVRYPVRRKPMVLK